MITPPLCFVISAPDSPKRDHIKRLLDGLQIPFVFWDAVCVQSPEDVVRWKSKLKIMGRVDGLDYDSLYRLFSFVDLGMECLKPEYGTEMTFLILQDDIVGNKNIDWHGILWSDYMTAEFNSINPGGSGSNLWAQIVTRVGLSKIIKAAQHIHTHNQTIERLIWVLPVLSRSAIHDPAQCLFRTSSTTTV